MICDTCIYRNEDEYHKPCIVYRDDCEFYEREGDMTREEAIHKMEYSKRAYQMLIDEKVQEGVLVGHGINAEWSADTPIIDAYKDMLEACDMAIKALEQEPCDDVISRAAVLDLCDSTDPEYRVVHFKEDVECLPSVNQEPKADVLDKIRAEIAEYKDDKIIHDERNGMIDIVLAIIDKYKAESEEL